MELSAVKKIKTKKKKRKKEENKKKKKELHRARITWYAGYWPGMQMVQIQALESKQGFVPLCLQHSQ